MPDAPTREPQGQIACPLCGLDMPHTHDARFIEQERQCRPKFELWLQKFFQQWSGYTLRVSGWGNRSHWAHRSKNTVGDYADCTVESLWRLWKTAWFREEPDFEFDEFGNLRQIGDNSDAD